MGPSRCRDHSRRFVCLEGSPEAEAKKTARDPRRRPAVFLVHLRFVRIVRQVVLCANRPPVATLDRFIEVYGGTPQWFGSRRGDSSAVAAGASSSAARRHAEQPAPSGYGGLGCMREGGVVERPFYHWRNRPRNLIHPPPETENRLISTLKSLKMTRHHPRFGHLRGFSYKRGS